MQDLKELKDTKDNTAKDKDEIQNTAWNIVNDTYRTDIPLLFPPHLIAIGICIDWLLLLIYEAKLDLLLNSCYAHGMCGCRKGL